MGLKSRWKEFETRVPTDGDFRDIAVGGEPYRFDQVNNRNLREAYEAEYETREISFGELWLRQVRPALNYVGQSGLDPLYAESFARLLTQPYGRAGDAEYPEGSDAATFYNLLNELFANPSSPWVSERGLDNRLLISGGPSLEEYTNLVLEECAFDGNFILPATSDKSLFNLNDVSNAFCKAVSEDRNKFDIFFKVFYEGAYTTYINSNPQLSPDGTTTPDARNALMGDPGAFWESEDRAAPGFFIAGDEDSGQRERIADAAGVDLASAEDETPEDISGTAAVLELLQRHQCVLSYKTEQIIKYFFSLQDRSLENILMYNSEDASLIVNTLNNKPELVNFFNIPTDILSFAVPKIRLFKQLINEDGTTAPNSEEGALEFKFESFTDGSSLKSITEEGRGRGRGVGIKDATWSFEGTNPEEVTSFIDFNLKLFVQNMSDLFDGADFQDDPDPAHRAVFSQREPNILQLLAAGSGGQAASEGNSNTYTVKAVIGWELDSSIDLGAFSSRSTEEKDKIKEAIASTNKWLELTLYTSDINLGQDGTLEISLDYAASLDEQLSDDSMNILAINIGNNEEAAIQSILRARDIDASNAKVRSDEAGYSGDSGETEACNTGLVAASEIPNPDDPEEQIPLTNEEQALLTAARSDSNSDRNIFNNYNSIFSTLLNSSKVYRMYLDETAILGADGLIKTEGDSTDRSRVASPGLVQAGIGFIAGAVLPGADAAAAVNNARNSARFVAAGSGTSEETTQENVNDFTITSRSFSVNMLEDLPINKIVRVDLGATPVELAVTAPSVEIPDPEEGETQNEVDNANLAAAREAAGEINYSVDLQLELARQYSDENSSVEIDFFRLGDLLDQIIKNLKETPSSSLARRDEEAFKFISGVYTYVDGRGARKGVNYCDILVSVDKFREFFIEKVIRRLRVKYDLKAFIIDMINEFSFLSGTAACIEGDSSPIRGETRPSFSVFQAPTINFDNLGTRILEDELNDMIPDFLPDVTSDLGGLGPGNVVPTVLAPAAAEFFRENIAPESYYGTGQIGSLSNYFAILSSNYSLSPAQGETQIEKEVFDSNRGIHHIKLGSDRGLLKNVNFRKDEVPGRREQRIIEGGGFNLSVLREKYNAELSLFGCPFLYPGMYIYIDPSLIGLGFADQQSSVAQVLGIGGYYFINKVSNSLNSELEFETTLDLIWNSFGDHQECPINIIDSENYSLGEWVVGQGRLANGKPAPVGSDGEGTLVETTPADLARERGDPNAALVEAMSGGTGGVGTTQNFRPAPGARFRHLDP